MNLACMINKLLSGVTYMYTYMYIVSLKCMEFVNLTYKNQDVSNGLDWLNLLDIVSYVLGRVGRTYFSLTFQKF